MSTEKPNEGLAAVALDAVKRISDQKYLFALVLFVAVCIAVGAAAATIGLVGAVVVLVLLIGFAGVLAWIVRTLPDPAPADGTAPATPRKWSTPPPSRTS